MFQFASFFILIKCSHQKENGRYLEYAHLQMVSRTTLL